MAELRTFLLLLFFLLLAGCAVAGPRARWEHTRGGVEAGSESRCATVVSRLGLDAGVTTVRICVVRDPTPCAWAFPDGSIYVSRGLLALLDDAELTAAVAHEYGHLVSDGHAYGPAAVAGHGEYQDEEAAADAAGVGLLVRAGLDPLLMPRMLTKLAAALPADDPVRPKLLERAARFVP